MTYAQILLRRLLEPNNGKVICRACESGASFSKISGKRFYGVKDAIALMEESDDQILRTVSPIPFPFLQIWAMIGEKKLSQWENQKDQLVRAMAKIINSGMRKKRKK